MTVADQIRVTGVRAYGYHGVLAEERRVGQEFVVDLVLDVDLTAAAASDELSETVDYAMVAAGVVSVIEGEPCNLIEVLATRIADRVLTESLVQRVAVTVHKPHAPVGVPFTDVAVTITRPR